MSGRFLVRRNKAGQAFFCAVLSILALMNIAVWLLQDFTPRETQRPLAVPGRIGEWQGADLAMDHHELAILAPAQGISRGYRPREGGGDFWQVIRLNVIQSAAIGSLHNVYDSLIASGSRPVILKNLMIETRRGPLRASLIRYQNAQ